MNNPKADIGVIGLGVMGESLALNMESHGFAVAVHNRWADKIDDFINGSAQGKDIFGCADIVDFVNTIKKPRKVMLMVKAGVVVDDFIEKLTVHLDKGDIIIDGGNSHYTDSNRRAKALEARGLHFVGAGVSGGEEGALKGPAIMPGLSLIHISEPTRPY